MRYCYIITVIVFFFFFSPVSFSSLFSSFPARRRAKSPATGRLRGPARHARKINAAAKKYRGEQRTIENVKMTRYNHSYRNYFGPNHTRARFKSTVNCCRLRRRH